MENAFFARCPHGAFFVLAISRLPFFCYIVGSIVFCIGIDDMTFRYYVFIYFYKLLAGCIQFNILSVTIVDGTLNF